MMFSKFLLPKNKIEEGINNNRHRKIINAVSSSVARRFQEFQESVIFKDLPIILDVPTWPKNKKSLQHYGDQVIRELPEFYNALLMRNGCKIDKVLSQWNPLKV